MSNNLPRNEDGTLQSFAWPGGYPIVYIDKECEIFCPKCANESEGIVDYVIHWEGESEYCCNCNREIESAYGPVEDETNE